MCGIVAIFTAVDGAVPAIDCAPIKARGPDGFAQFECSPRCVLSAAVLHMHGSVLQPIVTPTFVLAYNGEMYMEHHDDAASDTLVLANRLSDLRTLDDLGSVIDGVELEGALCVYCAKTQSLYFARDAIGRRSLVMLLDPARRFLIVASSAVCDAPAGAQWTEVDVAAVFKASVVAGQVQIACLERLGATRLRGALAGMDFSHALDSAVRARLAPNTLDPSSDVGILFSGGVDCVALAALAHGCVGSGRRIHLLNASFYAHDQDQANATADRINARDAYEELDDVLGAQTFALVCVDVSADEVARHRKRLIALMAPKATVMDFNLACVLYFAARAAVALGLRCLLSGAGADELLGGVRLLNVFCYEFTPHSQYGRHGTALQRGGTDAWRAELDMDMARLWTRNLGRDDRVTSAHGVELRLPFLDARVAQAVRALPPRLEGGKNKAVLRGMVAALGLTRAAARGKKAAQFGSGIAKLTGGNGTDDVATLRMER